MPGYLERINQLERDDLGITPDYGMYEYPRGYEINEINELSPATNGDYGSDLLARRRTGHQWLLGQHEKWQADDPTAATDAEFLRVWNAWWDLDQRLRADHGFRGCLHGPDESCPEGFPCQGCADVPTPRVVAQLALGSVE